MREDRGHVLFAEDNEDFRESLSDGLRSTGFRVTPLADGAAALRAVLATEPPFIVLTDLLMPKLSGQELIEDLRERGLLDLIPVVVLSAVVDAEVKATVVIEKPIEIRDLGKALDVQMRFAERHKDEARERLRLAKKKRSRKRRAA